MGSKINLEEKGREGVDLINLRQERENWRCSLHAVKKLSSIKCCVFVAQLSKRCLYEACQVVLLNKYN